MNKVFLIIQREFLNRVQKKSFLIATIIIPMIFPAIMAVLGYVAIQQKKNAQKEVIHYIDESGLFVPDTSKFRFKPFQGSLDDGKKAYIGDDSFGLLYVPKFEIKKPNGIALYTKVNPSPGDIDDLENMLEQRIREIKMQQFSIDKKVLDSLKTSVSIETIKLSESGAEESSNSTVCQP